MHYPTGPWGLLAEVRPRDHARSEDVWLRKVPLRKTVMSRFGCSFLKYFFVWQEYKRLAGSFSCWQRRTSWQSA
jgi:hypothetical protein